MRLFPETTLDSYTNEAIFQRLVSLEAEAHMLHLNTMSYAQHKALDELYSGIQGFRDTIMENLIGNSGKRLMPIKGLTLNPARTATDLAMDTINFAVNLKGFAETKGWTDLSNIADEFRALGVKVKYLLTLS